MDELMRALAYAHRMQQAHDEAMIEHQGYSWGYFGNKYISALSEAEEYVKDALVKVIDERIKIAMGVSNDT